MRVSSLGLGCEALARAARALARFASMVTARQHAVSHLRAARWAASAWASARRSVAVRFVASSVDRIASSSLRTVSARASALLALVRRAARRGLVIAMAFRFFWYGEG
jgi:hypothetical protein